MEKETVFKDKTKIHELKTWIKYFKQVKYGNKKFEVRKNDRDFQVGDRLDLMEWDEVEQVYTGDHVHVFVKYILKGGQFGIAEDTVVMSIDFE